MSSSETGVQGSRRWKGPPTILPFSMPVRAPASSAVPMLDAPGPFTVKGSQAVPQRLAWTKCPPTPYSLEKGLCFAAETVESPGPRWPQTCSMASCLRCRSIQAIQMWSIRARFSGRVSLSEVLMGGIPRKSSASRQKVTRSWTLPFIQAILQQSTWSSRELYIAAATGVIPGW